MSRVRRALTFENVLVTVVAFAVLAGGTAIAAGQLAKNSVGKRQLKASSVTTAKIKKNAVTAAKIRAGAVDGGKVKDGSLTLADLDTASLPFGRVVHRASSTAAVDLTPVAPPGYTVISLDKPAYTQEAGSDDFVSGAIDVQFNAACKAPRIAAAFALVDLADPAKVNTEETVALGQYADFTSSGASTVRLELSPVAAAGPLQPGAATPHTLSLLAIATCSSGKATGSNATLDVTGVK